MVGASSYYLTATGQILVLNPQHLRFINNTWSYLHNGINYLVESGKDITPEQRLTNTPVSERLHVRATATRIDFVERLNAAVLAIGCKPTPTEIARSFNLRFPHDAVTAQAVRRWMKGQSFPTDAKMVALGEWLSVDAAWLRFGDTVGHPAPIFKDKHDDSLERDIAMLNPEERAVIRKVTDLMLSVRAGRKA